MCDDTSDIHATCEEWGILPRYCSCEDTPSLCDDDVTADINATDDVTSDINATCKEWGILPRYCSCEDTPILCDDDVIDLPDETTNYTTYQAKNFNSNITLFVPTISVVCSFFGIIGNSAVLTVSYLHRVDISHNKLLIAELALVDLTNCVVQCFQVIHKFWSDEWVYGLAMCKILRSCKVLADFLCIGLIVIITLERFVGIIFPFQIKFSRRTMTHILVAINVFLAIAAITPYFYFVGVDTRKIRCEWEWYSTNFGYIYHWIIMVMYCIAPVVAVFVLYIIIIWHLRRQLQENTAISGRELMEKRVKENRRIMWILLSLVVGFLITVVPAKVIELYLGSSSFLTSYENISLLNTHEVLVYIDQTTQPLGVCIHPILYSAIDPKWRAEILQVVICRCNKRLSQRYNKQESTERKTRVTVECRV